MQESIRFDRFELRPRERLLLDGGVPCELGARAFDVLLCLIERRDRVVERSEVLNVVWAGLVVEENNLSVQVSALRKLLGPRAISTVPNRGYQFTLGVEGSAQAQAYVAIDPMPATAGNDVQPMTFAEPGVRVELRRHEGAMPAFRSWWSEVAVTLPSYDGVAEPGLDEDVRAATFVFPHRAVDFVRRLRASAPPGRITIRIHALDEPLAPIADDAQPEVEVLVSAAVAGRLTIGLDGDLQRLGPAASSQRMVDASPPPSFSWRAGLDDTASTHTIQSRLVDRRDAAPAVAVLPFRSYGHAVDGFGIGDILADQVITLLSHHAGLAVISRLSTNAFRERPCSLHDIAESMAADYLVSGRFFELDGRLSVDVEVADVSGRKVLWKHAARDATTAVLLADSLLVLELVTGVVRAVASRELDRMPGVGMPSLDTHALLLTAIGLMYRLAPADFTKSRQALDSLRVRLPDHAVPLAWLSRWHLFRVVQGWTDRSDEDGRLAADYAQRALDHDPDSALALTMLGNARTSVFKDPEGAEKLYDAALARNPNESLAWLQKGNALSFRGEGARALQHIEKAIALSPLDPAKHFYQALYAGAALAASDYARAIDAAKASLRLNSEHVSTYRILGISLSMLGRMEEARQAVATVRRLEPGLTVRSFVARSPGAGSGLAQKFGDALGAAGLPSGD